MKPQFKYWALFDFANSLLYTNLVLYFPQWLTIDLGVSDFFYNLLMTLSTVLLILTAPLLGFWADRTGGRVRYLRITAFVMIIASLAIPVFGLYARSNFQLVVIIMLAFLVVNFAYQINLLFYDSLLGTVADREQYVKASGIGMAAGWLGAIVGIILVLPIAQGSIPGIPSGRIPALMFSSLLFLLVGSFALWFLKEPEISPSTQSNGPALSSVIQDAKGIFRNPVLLLFLAAYWLYADAILTIQENLTIFLEKVYALPDSRKALVAIAIIVAGIVGALGSAYLIRRDRAISVLVFAVISASALIFVLSTVHSFAVFFVLVSLLFLVFGVILALSRPIYTELIPAEKRAEFFGFYSIAEKSSSMIGPLLWGGIVSFGGLSGTLGYRISMGAMAAILALSLIPLLMLRRKYDRKGQSYE
jgi:UMF1 family MFS transporter